MPNSNMSSGVQQGSQTSMPGFPDGESEHIHDVPGRHIQNEDAERVWLLSSERTLKDNGEPQKQSGHPSALYVTIAASVLILIVDMVAAVPTAPRMVIFEDIICRNHYAAWHGSQLRDCKVEPIQSELAKVNAWKETFDTIPGLLVTIPYGALANRIGRKKVLMLALIGGVLSDSWVAFVCTVPQILPLRAIWLSGLFQLIGGGGATVTSMCFTMIGDVCSAEQRTAAFSQVHAAVLLSEFISIPLGSLLISLNPWIPVLGSIGFMATTILFAFLFTPDFTSPALTNADSSKTGHTLSPASFRGLWHPLSQTIAAATASPWLTRDVIFMLVAFLLCQLGRQFSSVLLQYSSFKFHWEYSKASYVVALGAGIKLLVLVTVIPALAHFLTHRRGFSHSQADKHSTIFSGCCLVIGSVLLFSAPSPLVLILGQTFIALGFAFTVTARSFLTAMVDQRYLSLLYTSVTVVTYAGVIVGGPLLAGAFQWGLRLGQAWVGMPFLLTATLFGAATLAVVAAKGPQSV